jgi:hypothetical protein
LTHHSSHEFWACYNALPASIREQTNKAFELLKANPQHPSLHFKKEAHNVVHFLARAGTFLTSPPLPDFSPLIAPHIAINENSD